MPFKYVFFFICLIKLLFDSYVSCCIFYKIDFTCCTLKFVCVCVFVCWQFNDEFYRLSLLDDSPQICIDKFNFFLKVKSISDKNSRNKNDIEEKIIRFTEEIERRNHNNNRHDNCIIFLYINNFHNSTDVFLLYLSLQTTNIIAESNYPPWTLVFVPFSKGKYKELLTEAFIKLTKLDSIPKMSAPSPAYVPFSLINSI